MVTNINDCDDIIETQLNNDAQELENLLESDIFTLNAPLVGDLDDYVREFIELLKNREGSRNKLACMLTTDGGYINVVHRIVDTLRRHYDYVSFIVPNYAYSAGTVLAMSGDAIYMDYYSRLGPIDPQVGLEDGSVVPALGYLIQWDRLLKKAEKNKITQAEKELMIVDRQR
jgi:ATP-dependent protease ClpP protease subunit